MELLLRIRIDDGAADAYNASLYEPENGDPVQGDGRSLVRDLFSDGTLAMAAFDARDRFAGAITSVEATLDGEALEIPARSVA